MVELLELDFERTTLPCFFFVFTVDAEFSVVAPYGDDWVALLCVSVVVLCPSVVVVVVFDDSDDD